MGTDVESLATLSALYRNQMTTLLSPSLRGLRHMVNNMCEESCGKEYHVTFNDKKTIGVVLGCSSHDCKTIRVNGNNVVWSTKAKHLGNVIDHKTDTNMKKGSFIASINWFVVHFSGKVYRLLYSIIPDIL